MSYVYILRCRDRSLYTGATKDLDRRIAEHRKGTASKYTRSRRPVALVWSRRVRAWERALQLEYRIKHLRRSEKERVVAGTFDPRRLLRRVARGD